MCGGVTNVPPVDLSVRMLIELGRVSAFAWLKCANWSASERAWHLYFQSVERSRPQPTVSCLLCLSATHCKTSAFEQSGVLLSSVLFSPIGPTSCRTVLCRVSRMGGVRLAILVSISTPSGIPCQMKCVPLTHDQLQILHWSKLRIFTELLLFCLVVAISQNSAVNNEFEANRR